MTEKEQAPEAPPEQTKAQKIDQLVAQFTELIGMYGENDDCEIVLLMASVVPPKGDTKENAAALSFSHCSDETLYRVLNLAANYETSLFAPCMEAYITNLNQTLISGLSQQLAKDGGGAVH